MNKPRMPIPSVDEVLRGDPGRVAVARFGHAVTVAVVRALIEELRQKAREGASLVFSREQAAARLGTQAIEALQVRDAPRLRPVFNLTGTVLHTNLGRAILAEEAIGAAVSAMGSAAALEFDLVTGTRGERDDAVRELVCELTGAEDAIVVNNNAAAVLLVLNTLALGKETIVSRGELIEIGGSFRMPEIMARAGTQLVEVGTTNRTHMKDYVAAIGDRTGLILKVHTSNYLVQGFTKEVATSELARLGHQRSIAICDDLGSGTLVDLGNYGMRRERTVRDAVGDGADLVTFSGDKLLGGPQTGFIVGRKELVAACASNPMKRAVRLDKVRLAALEATLKLYRDPDRLAERLPTLRHLTRPASDIEPQAWRIAAAFSHQLGDDFSVSVRAVASQIGSGALPLESIPSFGVTLTPLSRNHSGRVLEALAASLRRLPVPVIGRLEKGALVLDVRCLDEEDRFLAQLAALRVPSGDRTDSEAAP